MSPLQTPDAVEPIALAAAAEQLGVHYMTAYRYVRTGRLYAVKRGGQWWVEQAAIDALRNEDVAAPRADSQSRKVLLEAFTTRLMAGDAGGCWDLITNALRSGAPAAEVHERLIGPALTQVGQRWADGEISIACEHRATATANRLIGQMGPLFRHPGRRRGTVVVGVVAGDVHGLPSAMLADLLTDRRFEVIDLGANTPVESFVETASDIDDLVGVGVGVMLETLIDDAILEIAAIRAELPTTFLVAGGPVVSRYPDRFANHVDRTTSSAVDACEAFEAAAAPESVPVDA